MRSLRALPLIILLFVLPANGAELEIHYVNVGWGSAVFVRGPDGTTLLLEAGNTGKGTAKVVPYLKSIGVQPAQGLDYVIGGHQHCDHIGGLDEVIQAGYDVHQKNYYNGSSTTSTCVTDWNMAAAATTAGAPVAMPVGTVIPLGEGATATCVARNGAIIGGGSVTVSDENDRSIALLIQHGGFDYLWASDLGGGATDTACTGRSTSQKDVESLVIAAISPGGAAPLIAAGGIDVLHVNHHGSESSTNANWMNGTRPTVAVIATGAGQGGDFELPRIAVVENVLRAAVPCITVPPAIVLQSEEGAPMGPKTSTAGYAVGDIVIRTDGMTTFSVSANGAVTQGPNESAAAGLPFTQELDRLPVPANVVATATDTSHVAMSSERTPLRGLPELAERRLRERRYGVYAILHRRRSCDHDDLPLQSAGGEFRGWLLSLERGGSRNHRDFCGESPPAHKQRRARHSHHRVTDGRERGAVGGGAPTVRLYGSIAHGGADPSGAS